jgi:hypothetical protein
VLSESVEVLSVRVAGRKPFFSFFFFFLREKTKTHVVRAAFPSHDEARRNRSTGGTPRQKKYTTSTEKHNQTVRPVLHLTPLVTFPFFLHSCAPKKKKKKPKKKKKKKKKKNRAKKKKKKKKNKDEPCKFGRARTFADAPEHLEVLLNRAFHKPQLLVRDGAARGGAVPLACLHCSIFLLGAKKKSAGKTKQNKNKKTKPRKKKKDGSGKRRNVLID